MTAVRGGRPFYGQALGVLMLDKRVPRIPGDMGNAWTFDVPVCFQVVPGVQGESFRRGDRALVGPIVRAARDLEAAGVRAIAGCSGFFASYQQDLAEAVSVPVFSSSLLLLPLIHEMLGRRRGIGVVTADAAALGTHHFEAVGAAHVPVVVEGLERYGEIRAILDDEETLDPERLGEQVVAAVRRLRGREPGLGALLLECHNLPPYGPALRRETDLPIFDIYSLVALIEQALVKKEFRGLL
jgi:hypothetical protein